MKGSADGAFWGELYLTSTKPFLLPERTQAEVDYLARAFEGLCVPGPVVDLGCGHGRHAGPLATCLGRAVIGVDFDAYSLERREGPFLAVQADFLALPFRADSLAGAYAWYSTFFAVDDATLERALHEVGRSLSPGGLLVLHTVPLHRAEQSPDASYSGTLPDGCKLTEESHFDPATGRDTSRRTLATPDGRVLTAEFFIRHYRLPDLTLLLKRCGFELQWVHGDTKGAPLSEQSEDLIVGATRRHG